MTSAVLSAVMSAALCLRPTALLVTTLITGFVTQALVTALITGFVTHALVTALLEAPLHLGSLLGAARGLAHLWGERGGPGAVVSTCMQAQQLLGSARERPRAQCS